MLLNNVVVLHGSCMYILVTYTFRLIRQLLLQPQGGYTDGSHCRRHPLFSTASPSLQIFLYYDDLEVCNPLGSKAKVHKLSMSKLPVNTIKSTHQSHL